MRAVSDDERKNKASEQDAGAEDEAIAKKDEEAEAGATEGEEEPSDAEGEGAAHRVAEALGVADDEPAAEKPAEGEDEAAPAQNRAARRAEAAQRRKKRKTASAGATEETTEEAADEALPKDKNARAKKLLERRREQAATATARPVQLLPGEMVDDALARSASAVGKWLRANFSKLQWVIVGAAVAGGAYAFYLSQSEKRAATASDALTAGVRAERGRVLAEDKRPDEEKELDPTKVFKTADERAENALASYRKVIAEHAGTGAAILAKLGEAGALLEKRDWDKAREAFSSVASSTLASADPDVKARALEGLGFAKEGKKDLDGAAATFKELAGIAGFKELGQYHEARILLAKGDTDKAKDLLKQVREALEKPGEGNAQAYLKAVTDEQLRRIDPALVPPKPMIGKGGQMSREDMERAIKKMQENLEKGGKDKH